MENIKLKEKYLWMSDYLLDVAEMQIEIFQKTKDQQFFDWAQTFYQIMQEYKTKLKSL